MDIREQEYQRGYAQVDLDAILENVSLMKQNMMPSAKMIGVVKADGYGHGSIPIARCLEALDFFWGFAVATPEEAFELRDAGITKPLLVLGYTFPYCYERMIREEIRPAVFRLDQVRELVQAASDAHSMEEKHSKVKVHVKVDTGMNRIGITPNTEGLLFLQHLKEETAIEIEGIFTHFARADEKDKTSAQKQLQLFQDFVNRAERELAISIPLKHSSNSAAVLEMPEANMDAVRAGISLYGLYPSGEIAPSAATLRPALSLHSRIVFLKTLYPGQSVSYGGTYTAREEMRIATIPVGYGDGYPRSLSNKGYILIHGKKAPILGRVCMDQFMVDVTGIPEAAEGMPVTLLGQDGEQCIRAEELAVLSGRFHYELVCDLGKRIPRVYLRNGVIENA